MGGDVGMNMEHTTRRMAKISEQAGALWRDHRYTGLVFLCCLLQLTSIMAMKSTISLFVVEAGGSTLAAGMLSTLIVLCAMIVKPVAGALLDRVGPRPLFVAVTVLVVCAALGHRFTLVTHAAAMLVASVMLVGIAHSSLSIIEVPLFIGQAAAQRQEVYMINLVGFNTVMATAIAPTLSQEMLNRYGFSTLYTLLIVMSIAGLCLFQAVAGRLRKPVSHAAVPSAQRSGQSSLRKALEPFRNRLFLLLFAANLTWGMSNGTLLTFLIPFGKTIGIENMGLFFTLYSGVNICLRWVVPAFIHRIGRKRVLLMSFGCLTLGTLLLWAIRDLPTMVLPAILAGLGTSSIYTPIVSSVLDVMPAATRMRGLGVFLVSFEIGQGLASMIIGVCSQFMTYPQMFLIIAAFQLLGMICVCFGVPKDGPTAR